MHSRLPDWLQNGLRLLPRLLPCSCALCGHSAPEVVCLPCRQQFFTSHVARCRCCALPLAAGEHSGLCGACLRAPPAYEATVVVADYAAPIDQLVLALKFGAQLGLAAWMAGLLRDALLRQSDGATTLPDLLCPVPLGMQRLRERGYNQALEIARPLSRSLGVALDARLCMRRHDTPAQSMLPLDQRALNMKNAFLPAPHAAVRIAGLHIGVVDDVMTSGQTLQAMAGMLKHFGAARVSNFVFARTPPPTNR